MDMLAAAVEVQLVCMMASVNTIQRTTVERACTRRAVRIQATKILLASKRAVRSPNL